MKKNAALLLGRLLILLTLFAASAASAQLYDAPGYGASSYKNNYFSDNAQTQQYYADNAHTQYYSSADIGYSPPPVDQITDVTQVVNGMDYFWDALTYVSGQTWPNAVPSPADGSAQTDSDSYLGTSGTPGGNNPTYGTNNWVMTGSALFTAQHANPSQIAMMQNTSSGNGWSWFARAKTGNTVLTDPTPAANGTGYAINNLVTTALVDSTGKTVATTASVYKVTSINGGGGILTVAINNGGKYISQPQGTMAVVSTTGSGTGATFNVIVSPALNTVFATANGTGDTGVNISTDSGGNFKLTRYDGTGSKTATAAYKLAIGQTYNLYVEYSQVYGQVYFSVNGQPLLGAAAAWTSHPTGSATYGFTMGSGPNGNTKYMPAGTLLYAQGVVNHAMNQTEVSYLDSWLNSYYSNNLPAGVPGQVASVSAMPDDGQVNLAWAQPADNAAAITDYVVQYKLDASPTWLTFSHSPSPNLFNTVTGITDGQLYDFREAAVNSQGQGPFSAVQTATPVANGTAPYDVSQLKLTLPVNSAGQRFGNAVEVNYGGSPDLATFTDAWFGRANGQFILNVPDGGANTSTTTYARTEFRNNNNIPNTQGACDTLKTAVLAIPASQKVIIDQIHSPSGAEAKIEFLGSGSSGTGKIYGIFAPDQTIIDPVTGKPKAYTNDIKTGMTTGSGSQTVIQMCYTTSPYDLKIWLDGRAGVGPSPPGTTPDYDFNAVNSPAVFDMSHNSDATYYFKRGAYFDNNSFQGNIAQVVHYTQAGIYHP